MNAAANAAAPTADAPPAQDTPDAFASKTEADSAAEYFRSARPSHAASCRRNADGRYYSQLWAQQNMLQDIVRTGIYHSAGKRPRRCGGCSSDTLCSVDERQRLQGQERAGRGRWLGNVRASGGVRRFAVLKM